MKQDVAIHVCIRLRADARMTREDLVAAALDIVTTGEDLVAKRKYEFINARVTTVRNRARAR